MSRSNHILQALFVKVVKLALDSIFSNIFKEDNPSVIYTFIPMHKLVSLYGEGRPRLDLEYPVYGAHELADERALTSVVELTASFPSGFRRGRDLNPRPSLQGKLVECVRCLGFD